MRPGRHSVIHLTCASRLRPAHPPTLLQMAAAVASPKPASGSFSAKPAAAAKDLATWPILPGYCQHRNPPIQGPSSTLPVARICQCRLGQGLSLKTCHQIWRCITEEERSAIDYRFGFEVVVGALAEPGTENLTSSADNVSPVGVA